MSESAFREILGEAIKSELAEFDNVPVHKFSLKHRLAMKRIFAKFERNASKMKKRGKSGGRTKSRIQAESKPKAAPHSCTSNFYSFVVFGRMGCCVCFG